MTDIVLDSWELVRIKMKLKHWEKQSLRKLCVAIDLRIGDKNDKILLIQVIMVWLFRLLRRIVCYISSNEDHNVQIK